MAGSRTLKLSILADVADLKKNLDTAPSAVGYARGARKDRGVDAAFWLENCESSSIGCTVYQINPVTGKQWSFSESTTGHHFQGNADGIITGLPQAPKSPHLLEIKTASDKMFKDMQKSGVKKSKPEHYAQMQIYMKWSIDQFGADGCQRALYFVVNKDNDDIYTCITSSRIRPDSTCRNNLLCECYC